MLREVETQQWVAGRRRGRFGIGDAGWWSVAVSSGISDVIGKVAR